jgi:transglutaminase-like putative cysteine protease
MVVRTIDPSYGVQVVTVRRGWREEGVVEAMGKVVPATAWVVEQSVAPGVETVEWVGADGAFVRGEVEMGGFTLTMLATEREVALSPWDGPELMARTLVEPSRRIERPREAARASYVVRVREGELPDLPTTGSQRFERIDARSGRVVVTREPIARGDERASAETLSPSVMISSDDPVIGALVRDRAGRAWSDGARVEAIPDGAQWSAISRERAEPLRRLAHSYITSKTLDLGFATASEVARTHEGDCTEHAVFLAALLRACGTPGRCASGVVYVENFAGREGVFGFHMWAQGLLERGGGGMEWRDLDATLDGERAFDAAHIALTVSALGDEERVNSLAAMAPLIGSLEIEVESVEYE